METINLMNKMRNDNQNKKKSPYRYQVLYQPGRYMNEKKIKELSEKIRSVAAECFNKIPDYQAMRGTRSELTDKVISIAWKQDGSIAGFCSTVLLDVPEVGKVVHLGLTCVSPTERNRGLTHELTNRAVGASLLRHKPLFGRLWITNCAAVLSSLVNVALYFEEVYPSPLTDSSRTQTHRRILEAIDKYYRDKIYIRPEAELDSENFVFRGSVKNTVFQKEETDTGYHHRDSSLNDYYRKLMNFKNGDEVVQIGFASTYAAVRHLCLKKIFRPLQIKKTS